MTVGSHEEKRVLETQRDPLQERDVECSLRHAARRCGTTQLVATVSGVMNDRGTTAQSPRTAVKLLRYST